MFYHPLTTRNKNKENQNQIEVKSARKQLKKFGKEIKEKLGKKRNILSNTLNDVCNVSFTPIRHFEDSHQQFPQKNSQSSQLRHVKFSDSYEKFELKRKLKSSILKNSLRKSGYSEKSSSRLSIQTYENSCVGQFQSMENKNSNKVIEDKYLQSLESIKKKGQQYTDQLFPPNMVSYLYSKVKTQVRWMRISELYRDYKIILWNNKKNNNIITISSQTPTYLLTTFNLIQSCSSFMEKIFQNQQPNITGIYLLNIIQGNKWKKIIIDDFIPVEINPHNKYAPLSLHCPIIDGQVQIWPLLLEKAYAKYYSNYECLKEGNCLDFLQQITGVVPQKITLSLKNGNKLQNVQPCYGNIILAQKLPQNKLNKKDEHDDQVVGIYENKFVSQIFQYRKNIRQNEVVTIYKDDLNLYFKNLYVHRLHQFAYNGVCEIRQKIQDKNKFPISVRVFKLTQNTKCTLTISQKEKRFYRGGKYSYVWIRIILLMKELNNNFRWIQAEYKNTKNISLNRINLETGEYVLLIMPQWKEKSFQLSLSYSGTSNTIFQRNDYSQQILLEGCMDIAQRKGKMHQVSRNVYHKIGFIIQNVNNERSKGQLKIIRSIEGLQNLILPINKQFCSEKTIQLYIKSQNYFSIVFRTFGGPQQQILSTFDFGID